MTIIIVQRYLPAANNGESVDTILDKLFDHDATFFFGHPIRNFHRYAVMGAREILRIASNAQNR